MKVAITDALAIDLDAERWECRGCGSVLGEARAPYKHGLLVRARDPREIHAPILDPDAYDFTFAPDPAWVQILEYCCPACGRLAEVEYLPPGHPPTLDIAFDIDALKARAVERSGREPPEPEPDFVPPPHHHAKHSGSR